MKYNFHNTFIGVSVLPAFLVMPAFADTITERQVISSNTTYTDVNASNITSDVPNNGGVFYMQDVPDVLLTFDGDSIFDSNAITGGGMGGVIGNGWLASVSGTGYTQGGKILFNGASTFNANTTNATSGGGAIFNYGLGTAENPDITFDGTATFTNNQVSESITSVYAGGGAINHRNGMIVFNQSADFSGNKSASQGGAILSAGDIMFSDNVSFDSNTASTNGGALAMMGGDITFAKDTSFTKNQASGASAIFISETSDNLNFMGNATFSENTGVGTLLNNSASATVVFSDGATFDSNTNNQNGALVNAGTVDLTSGDLIFTNNTGSNGGGLKSSGTVSVDTTGNVLFSNNSTTSSAGALDNGGSITLAASQVSFLGNSSNAGYAGAIFNAGDLTISGAENIFSENNAKDTGTIKSGGGAIHNRGQMGTATLVIGTESSTNTFSANKSNAYGGAIVARAFDGENQNSEVTVNGTTSFVGNQSVLSGGAIWNAVAESEGTTGTSTIVFNNDVSFTNNTSGDLGGAIYNNDTITFNGASVFSGNTANSVANDIYNDGTITFNGDATLSGGVSGNGTLNIASGTTFNLGTADITQGAIELNGTMLATLRGGENAQITVNNDNGFTGSGTLKLAFDQAGTYHVFGNQVFNNIDITNPIYDLVWNGGDVTASTKSVADIAFQNNLTSETARVISSASDSSAPKLNNLSVLFQEKLASGTPADIAAVEHAGAAINPEKASVVQSVGVITQNTIASVASTRMLMSGMGRNGGDTMVDFGGDWAQGVYNKSKMNDTFNGYTRGIAAGFDGTINDAWTMGVGYLFSHSDVSATTRDTDIDSSNIFVYGQYKPSAWYANAVLNYTMSDYSEQGSALGVGVSADYDVDLFGAAVSTGYEFIGGLTPEMSVRYMHIGSSDYSNSLGIRNRIDSADYMTASLGTKYEFDVYMTNGFVFRPQLRYAVKYDLISDNSDITVTMPGVNAYVLDGQRLSRIANELGMGIAMNYRGLEMSLNYDIEARADYTSQTGSVKFRYEF